jgi:hypothetical protein
VRKNTVGKWFPKEKIWLAKWVQEGKTHAFKHMFSIENGFQGGNF